MSDLGELFVRLCAIGALLYIAVALLTDPASFVRMIDSLATEVRAFEERLRGPFRVRPAYFQRPINLSRKQSIVLQGAGVILIAISLLAIAA